MDLLERNEMCAVPPAILDPAVAKVFDGFPSPQRDGLLALRALIFDAAAKLPQIGGVQEVLRWGQPAYLTTRRAGTALRLGLPKAGGFALYVHCQTSLIRLFQDEFPKAFRYEGTRAVLFAGTSEIQPEKLVLLIRHALIYHLR